MYAHRVGVGIGRIKSFVLISDQQTNKTKPTNDPCVELPLCLSSFDNNLTLLFCIASHRINKKGSQKDQEQKSNGNYFFYDDGGDDEGEDIDDDDL